MQNDISFNISLMISDDWGFPHVLDSQKQCIHYDAGKLSASG